MPDEPWGYYVVVHVGEAARQEWTNVGILLYDQYGRLMTGRFDSLDRAVKRGSLPADMVAWYGDLKGYCESLGSTVEHVRRFRGSDGHIMSRLKFREPLGCRIDRITLNELYNRLVAPESTGET